MTTATRTVNGGRTANQLVDRLKLDVEFERFAQDHRVECADLVIVGSGIAGLTAAITAAQTLTADNVSAGQRIALLTKTKVGLGGSSPYAQGGIAAAVGGPDDEVEHAEDTVRVGRSLSDPVIVQRLTELGDEAVDRLVSMGVRFDRDQDGEFLLGREGGHHRRRVLHAEGDATGREIMRALRESFEELVHQHPGIVVVEDFFAEDLLVIERESGRVGAKRAEDTFDAAEPAAESLVAGVVGFDLDENGNQAGPVVAWVAPKVLLATGGMGQLYSNTTNPAEVTGDGIAMAARAGAVLADMEMVQFHPTTLDLGSLTHRSQNGASEAPYSNQAKLLTEALRGEGAHLLDKDGKRFMVDVHPLAELAPRDVVARTLWQRSANGEASFLDLRPVNEALVEKGGRLAERFPTAYKQCKAEGLDPLVAPVPIAPAAHYTMGGVWTDRSGRTSIDGLWACGEVASSGVHGANRLASNSLLEGVVFGHEFTLELIREELSPLPADFSDEVSGGSRLLLGDRELAAIARPRGAADSRLRSKIQRRMWQSAGLIRDGLALKELDRELSILQRFRTEPGPEERNLLLLGRLLSRAALLRTESRGGHYRSDFPNVDRTQARRSLATADELLDVRLRRGLRGHGVHQERQERSGRVTLGERTCAAENGVLHRTVAANRSGGPV